MCKRSLILSAIILPVLLFTACKKEKSTEEDTFVVDMSGTSILPSYSQRTGNSDSGYHYLIYGDYVSSGIPYNAFVAVNGGAVENLLDRIGSSANVPYTYNAVDAPEKNDVHHHLQSSAFNMKYVVTIVTHDVTIKRIM